MLDLTISLLIGFLQGVFEWLPISSKTAIMLFSMFLAQIPPLESYAIGLAVQGGTVVAAASYFRREIISLLRARNRKLLVFTGIATLATIVVAAPLYALVRNALGTGVELVGYVTLAVGAILSTQAILLLRLKPGFKKVEDSSIADAVITGLFQGLSVLPGFSRSGTTLIALLALKYDLGEALKISFILSIPINAGSTVFTVASGSGLSNALNPVGLATSLAVSAVTGLITIKHMLKLASTYGYKVALLLGLLATLVGLLLVVGIHP